MKSRWSFSCIALAAAVGGACEDAGSPASPTQQVPEPAVEPDPAPDADAGRQDEPEPDTSEQPDAGAGDAPQQDAYADEADAAKEDASSAAIDATTEAAAPEAGGASIRYSTDVAPVLERHCTKCHTLGAGAPFGLTSYDAVAPLANDVREAVVSGSMPPCNLLGSIDCGLSEEEIQLVSLWVDQGVQR